MFKAHTIAKRQVKTRKIGKRSCSDVPLLRNCPSLGDNISEMTKKSNKLFN